MKSPIYYGESVERNDGVLEAFDSISFLIQGMFEYATLEGEMEEYPLDSIVESLTYIFGNEQDAKNLLNTTVQLAMEIHSSNIETNLLLPLIHVVSVLPYFTEKIKALETTVENLQYALVNK